MLHLWWKTSSWRFSFFVRNENFVMKSLFSIFVVLKQTLDQALASLSQDLSHEIIVSSINIYFVVLKQTLDHVLASLSETRTLSWNHCSCFLLFLNRDSRPCFSFWVWFRRWLPSSLAVLLWLYEKKSQQLDRR